MNWKSVLALSLVVLLAIVCYKVVFVPTSLSMKSSPEEIFASSTSPVIVKATLVNKLGLPVPFTRVDGRFIVYEGADKIHIVRTEGNELIFKTMGSTGRLVIYYYSTTIPFPVEMILNIKESAIASLI